MTEPADEETGPEIWSLLTSALDTYRGEHEEGFLPPSDNEESRVHRALDTLEKYVFNLVTTGQIPEQLNDALSDYQPGSRVEDKLVDLLAYNVTHHRIEFEVGSDVCWRLVGLGKRVGVVAVAFILLLRSKPSDSAVKYLRQASTLYLGGYSTEVFVMCGAVLEATMSARITDDVLATDGRKPAYRHTGVYSLGQRMQYEEAHPFLTEAQRKQFWEVINWRNDAVHVQPDIAPDPGLAFVKTAGLLSVILPRPAFG